MLAAAVTLLTQHSRVLFEHLGHYASLAQAESELAARAWLLRVACGLLALALLTVGVTLAGVALLVSAALPPPATTWQALAPWLVPAVPLLLAGGAAWMAMQRNERAFARLREQWQQDVRLVQRPPQPAAAASPPASPAAVTPTSPARHALDDDRPPGL